MRECLCRLPKNIAEVNLAVGFTCTCLCDREYLNSCIFIRALFYDIYSCVYALFHFSLPQIQDASIGMSIERNTSLRVHRVAFPLYDTVSFRTTSWLCSESPDGDTPAAHMNSNMFASHYACMQGPERLCANSRKGVRGLIAAFQQFLDSL